MAATRLRVPQRLSLAPVEGPGDTSVTSPFVKTWLEKWAALPMDWQTILHKSEQRSRL